MVGESSIFAQLVRPLTPEAFAEDHWETFPHIGRGAASGLGLLDCTLEDFLNILSFQRLRNQDVTLFRNNARYEHDAFGDRDAPLRARVVECAMEDGCTLAMKELEYRHPAIARFAAQLSWEVQGSVTVMGFLTPPSCEGYQLHYDPFEFFVVQVSGSKSWDCSQPIVELPDEDLGQPALITDETPEVAATLQPGDVLYMPRGWRHATRAEAQYSLHFSVIVKPSSLEEELAARLRQQTVNHRKLRVRSLPWCRANVPPELPLPLASGGHKLRANVAWSASAFSLPSSISLPSHRHAAASKDTLNAFRWRDGVKPGVRLTADGNGLLEVDGMEVLVDRSAYDVMQSYCANHAFEFNENDGISPEQTALLGTLESHLRSERVLKSESD